MPTVIANDHISESLQSIIGEIPERYQASDEFLDVISWNLRWFNYREEQRVTYVSEILTVLNADVFIFQEVEFESLTPVVRNLARNGAGLYKVVYGTTGSDQRVAIMYDTEWVRAKDDIRELFGKGTVMTGDNKDAFPRLPLYGYFVAKSPGANAEGFTFQLVGLHLKSQMNDGGSQRRTAAEKLAYWLERDSKTIDADTIMIGDWNKPPKDRDWDAIHQLEADGEVKFTSINDDSDFSHLYYRNKRNLGSRLDICLVSTEAFAAMRNRDAQTCRWVKIDDLLNSAGERRATEIKAMLNEIKTRITDHMPLYTRYYLDDRDERPAAARPTRATRPVKRPRKKAAASRKKN